MRTLIFCMAVWAAHSLGLATADGADKAPPTGYWEGPLKVAPGVELALVVHVTKADGGGLKATFASPDQGPGSQAVDSIAFDGGELTFALKAINGSYTGKLNAEGTEAVGTWTQGGRGMALTLKRGDKPAAKAMVVPAGLTGIWEGKIKVATMELRIVLKVVKKEGGLVASFASPDQGVDTIPISSIALDGAKVAIESKLIAAKFAGKLNAGKTEITGTWTQGGQGFPLVLKKTDKVSQPKRTQVPKPPFPYLAEDVSYPNKAAGISLAGTLTIPEGKGPFPVALMITGSGGQDRDETLLGHKPFLVIADALTRRGIAVLRVDDRGVGSSTGSQLDATSEDFAGDVLAGIAYLKARKEVDPKAIGLIGHSEGGLIAPIVAARSGEVGFIVLLAGTGINGAEILKMQGQLILKAAGASEAMLKGQADLMTQILEVVRAEKDQKVATVKLQALAKTAIKLIPEEERKALGEMADKTIGAQLERVNTPWFRYFLAYEPKTSLAKVRCPVLAINGENDLQVPPKENLAAIEAAIRSGGNTRITTKELPGLNHLFQKSKTGSPSEYATIEETIDPPVLTLLADWIIGTTSKK